MCGIKRCLFAVQHLAALQGVEMEAGGGRETPMGGREKCSSQEKEDYFTCKFCLLRILGVFLVRLLHSSN